MDLSTSGIIFLAILALAFMGLNFYRRAWGVAIFCALLPVYLIRIKLGLPGLPTLPSTFLELLFGAMFLPWLFERGFKAEAWRGFRRWSGPIVLIFFAASIGVLVSPDIIGGLGLWRAYFLEPILFFALFTDTISDIKERRTVLMAMGVSLIVVGITAIFQKITGYGIPNPIWQAEETRRVTSFFGFPNAVGLFAAPLTVMMAAWSSARFLRGPQHRLWAIAMSATALLGLLACVFAVSKGALLGILAGLIVYGLTVKKLRPFALVLIIVACLSLSIYKPLINLTSNIVNGKDASSSVRIIVWDETLNMLADRPIYGSGLNGYQQAILPYHKAEHIEIFMYPHNLLLNFWTELGLIGLAGFIWLIILFFIYNAKMARVGMTWLPMGLIAAMTAILVHGIVDVPYLKNDLAFQFWILLGLAESMLLRTDHHPNFWEAAKHMLHLDEKNKA